jgi:hypothetical protein
MPQTGNVLIAQRWGPTPVRNGKNGQNASLRYMAGTRRLIEFLMREYLARKHEEPELGYPPATRLAVLSGLLGGG